MNEREIFVAALDKEDERQRAAYLDAVCGGDIELRAKIEVLLRESRRLGDFLETPAPGLAELYPPLADRAPLVGGSPLAAGRWESRVLGDYRILREIGRGGMGVVYEAEQISLHRRVALKMLPFAAVLDPKQLQRFQNEALAAASLKHPGIVQVYAVGCERGVHYYAMEYVEGRTLAEVIEELREEQAAGSEQRAVGSGQHVERAITPSPPPPVTLSPSHPVCPSPLAPRPSPLLPEPRTLNPEPFSPETKRGPQATVSTKGPQQRSEFFRSAAQLGIQAAEALEHAHQMGVVHRDIKPSNLIVAESRESRARDIRLSALRSPRCASTSPISAWRKSQPPHPLGQRVGGPL